MKLVSTQLSYLLTQHETRQNLRALAKYVIFLIAVIATYSAVFHWIMLAIEGQRHSWATGVYWTLTVMSTLGFGDITFESDLGRMFSMLVLVSGVVLLLIVLPFAFIRFFYAPWLEAQIRLRAPRALPAGTRGHVVVCHEDAIARGLRARLAPLGIPCHVIEPDLARAAELHGEGVPVVVGEVDAIATFAAVRRPTPACSHSAAPRRASASSACSPDRPPDRAPLTTGSPLAPRPPRRAGAAPRRGDCRNAA